MFGQYLRTVETTFIDRLKQAALYRRLEWSPTAIGKALGLPKQTVHRWMQGSSTPSPENVFLTADTWQISARWLATGEGSMMDTHASALNRQESEILAAYRGAPADGKSSLRTLARAVSRGALAVFLAISLWQPSPSHAAFSSNVGAHVYYGKCKAALRRLRRYLSACYLKVRLPSFARI
jgi:hypothetical protein